MNTRLNIQLTIDGSKVLNEGIEWNIKVGVILKTTYPITKLVITRASEDEGEKKNDVFEIEEILKHRSNKGKVEYFIKWSGYTSSENSWITEEDFDSTDIIFEYWENLTQPTLEV